MAMQIIDKYRESEDKVFDVPDVREDDVDIAVRVLEQELDRDCERYSRAYGTLGCCTTVNNNLECQEKQNHIGII